MSEYEIFVYISVLRGKVWTILLNIFLVDVVPLPFVSLLNSKVHFFIEI